MMTTSAPSSSASRSRSSGCRRSRGSAGGRGRGRRQRPRELRPSRRGSRRRPRSRGRRCPAPSPRRRCARACARRCTPASRRRPACRGTPSSTVPIARTRAGPGVPQLRHLLRRERIPRGVMTRSPRAFSGAHQRRADQSLQSALRALSAPGVHPAASASWRCALRAHRRRVRAAPTRSGCTSSASRCSTADLVRMIRYAKRAGVREVGLSTNAVSLHGASRRRSSTPASTASMLAGRGRRGGLPRDARARSFRARRRQRPGLPRAKRARGGDKPIISIQFMRTPGSRRTSTRWSSLAADLGPRDFVMTIGPASFAGAIAARPRQRARARRAPGSSPRW